jgi:glucuronoarabinoxylan endo-1,4-beta-xylanase
MVFGNMYAADDPEMKPAFDSKAVLPYDNFINELVNDLMPYIESHYSVLPGRENTAVCGFSMGGRESLYIGLSRPDLFAYIGAISPAPGLVPGKDGYMTHEGTLTEEQVHFPSGMPLPKSVLICCGTNDSVVGKFPKSYHELFEKNGIEHVWFEILNADHNNQAIRAGLAYFIQEIF